MSEISSQLLAANQRLHMLRQQMAPTQPVASASTDLLPPWELPTKSKKLTITTQVEQLPPHLGWGSQTVTQAIRVAQTRREKQQAAQDQTWQQQLHPLATRQQGANQLHTHPVTNTQLASDHVKLYPDIALGMLRQEQATTGRIWLLLRHIDREGRGWLRVDTARTLLTQKGAPLRVCGWRRLRQILAQGQGIFWYRDKTHIWLRGTGKVGYELDVNRLSGQPVALPLSALLSGIGVVKAHFYTSFHSGRRRNNPISRRTLSQISQVPAATQRLYEQHIGVKKKRNIAVGERHTTESVQKRAWYHGNGVFDFIDHHGRQGPEKRHYIAWHLPNSYEGCHEAAPRGRMKKINRQLDLVKQRAQGNELQAPLFHANGAKACKAWSRRSGNDAYWYNEAGRRKQHYHLWYVLPRQEGS